MRAMLIGLLMLGCADGGSHSEPDGHGWIVVDEGALPSLGTSLGDGTVRIAFYSAIHRYDPTADRTMMHLFGADAGLMIRLSWDGDVARSTSTMQPGVDAHLDHLPRPGEEYLADEFTAPFAIARFRFMPWEFAAQAKGRTSGELAGELVRSDGEIVTIWDSKIAAVRR